MTGTIFPMVVEFNLQEYVAVGLVSDTLPLEFALKVKREDLEKTGVEYLNRGGVGTYFVAYALDERLTSYSGTFNVLKVETCRFKRFVEKCVMCGTPKGEGG